MYFVCRGTCTISSVCVCRFMLSAVGHVTWNFFWWLSYAQSISHQDKKISIFEIKKKRYSIADVGPRSGLAASYHTHVIAVSWLYRPIGKLVPGKLDHWFHIYTSMWIVVLVFLKPCLHSQIASPERYYHYFSIYLKIKYLQDQSVMWSHASRNAGLIPQVTQKDGERCFRADLCIDLLN